MRTERGLTFIELLIAMAIFGVSIVGFSGQLLSGIRANRVAREIGEATAIAGTLESYRAGTPSCSSTVGIYSRACTTVTNTPVAGASTVAITISWPNGGTRNVTLRSVFAN